MALALTDRPGVLVVALASRLILWTPATDGRAPLGPRCRVAEVRFNDGRPDPLGRLVIGTMGNNVGPDGEALPVAPGLGKLFRFGRTAAFAGASGGSASPTPCAGARIARAFYFADTWRTRSGPTTSSRRRGSSARRGVLRRLRAGQPDGSAVDSEGYLWNCRYGGGCVVRCPDGEVERVVEMPCGNVTTCTFGGAGLRTLFITTAGRGGPRSGWRAASSHSARRCRGCRSGRSGWGERMAGM